LEEGESETAECAIKPPRSGRVAADAQQ